VRTVGKILGLLINVLLVLAGALLVIVAVGAFSVANDPEVGGTAAVVGLFSLVAGLGMTAVGVIWWLRRIRREEPPDPDKNTPAPSDAEA